MGPWRLANCSGWGPGQSAMSERSWHACRLTSAFSPQCPTEAHPPWAPAVDVFQIALQHAVQFGGVGYLLVLAF